ncbi:SOUL family heme-binding protein [Mycolicibacterium aichiense]|uniref:Heme-binding protein n=1 Tax=Mycolicibacterium aichiense TaxID=1799 RepID=A0AAD1HLD9_9MYCO|nr:heme-binding protein [Mycolicibacterium aichiense]MCV7019781.1 heme-binding protein [Mycolicibacterium aichiense]BBX06845.1 heme-binding protein [Mycolicibacterium aichiense]STZ80661.1 SOUL heme-binding protein [Mycolicibacterium aichiense]
MLKTVAGAVVQVAEGVGNIVGIRVGTEEPAFTVERVVDGVEIRRYGPRVAAETAIDADEESARNQGFRLLARYIFGGNSGSAKIAMTAPVAQQPSEKIAMTAPVATQRNASGEWVIRFFMPSKYTLETLPSPNDDRVRLVVVPPETVAVLRFNGSISPDAVSERTNELMKALHRNDIETTGEPLSWFYDPPWTLPCRRRNEVVVGVAESA